MNSGLTNLRVVSFESRRSAKLASLIQKRGGVPIEAPSMQEVPLQDQRSAIEFAGLLLGGEIDSIIFLTGVGARMLIDAMALSHPRSEILAAVKKCDLLCRGPKPVAYLKEIGLSPCLTAPEPNTWRELLSEISASNYPLHQKRVALQEYGRSNPDLQKALTAQAQAVHPIPIYAWSLPDDTSALQSAIDQIVAGDVDVVLFTSGQQVENVVEVARQANCLPALLNQLQTRVLIASIGPITTEAIEQAELQPDLHPPRPKMGSFISDLAQRGASLLEEKRRAHGLEP